MEDAHNAVLQCQITIIFGTIGATHPEDLMCVMAVAYQMGMEMVIVWTAHRRETHPIGQMDVCRLYCCSLFSLSRQCLVFK